MKTKRLPASLCSWLRYDMRSEELKALNKLCGDGRARIVYDMNDRNQPLPHRAVLLKGYEVEGWVLRIHHQFNEDTPGLNSRDYDALLLRTVSQYKSEDDLLQRLCTREHSMDEDGKSTERVEWNKHACEELTDRFGMIEVIDKSHPYQVAGPKKFDRNYYAVALVPKEKSWAWETVYLGIARSRAEWDLRPKAFWTLRARTDTYRDGEVYYELKSFCPGFRIDHYAPPSTNALRGATEITIEADGRTLRMYRHNSDGAWTLDARDSSQTPPRYIHATYAVAAGSRALTLALQAWREGKAPALPPDTDFAAEHRDFMDYVNAISIEARTLEFVAKAFELPDPLQTTPELAAEVPA